MHRTQLQLIAGFALWLALLVAFISYSPGLAGGLHFDDEASLSGLSAVARGGSALEFIFSGNAGPLGRPIALASFAAQAYAWPDFPEMLLYTNVLIHLLNGVFIAWIGFLVNSLRGVSLDRSALAAALISAIWLVLPLLASSSLFIIQRMTTLSAAFLLLGVIWYLKARQGIDRSPSRSLIGMSGALILGTLFSSFTKENGVLMPVFVLAIEICLLDGPKRVSERYWRLWLSVFMLLPLAIIFYYLVGRIPYDDPTITARHFNGAERLFSQVQITWIYVLAAFVPNPSYIGPFHDDYSTQDSKFLVISLLALVGWAMAAAIALRFRQRYPELIFGLVWFLVGHLLESTVVPLELYFEHRNYVPILGPIFALVSFLVTREPQSRRKITWYALCAYFLVLASSLLNQASIWGSPRLAAEMWVFQKPDSVRALLFLISQLEQERDYHSAIRLADEFLSRHPNAQQARLQKMIFSCFTGDQDFLKDEAQQFSPVSHPIGFGAWASNVPRVIYALRMKGQCANFSDGDITSLARKLLLIPEVNVSSVARHNLHSTLAVIAVNRGDLETARVHLDEALAASFNSDALEVALLVASETSDFERAGLLLKDAEYREPSHPIRAFFWNRELARLESLVAARAARDGREWPISSEDL